MFWFLFTLVVLFLAALGDEMYTKNAQTRTIARVLLVLVLSYAIALCGNGTDIDNYLYFYNKELANFKLEDILGWLSFRSVDTEPGFVLLGKVCQGIGLSAVGFLLVVSLITNALTVNFIYRYRYSTLVVFLYIVSYYYVQQANLVRQGLAVAICLYAVRYVLQKKFLQYLLLVLLAFTVHKTALIQFAALPLFFINFEKRNKIINITLLALWLFSFSMVLHLFPLLERLSVLLVDTRYVQYGSDAVTFGIEEVRFSWVINFFVLFYFVFTERKNTFMAYFLVLDCSLENAAFAAPLFVRLAIYFIPFFFTYLPTLISENRIADIKASKQFTTITQILVFLYYLRILVNARVLNQYNQIGGHIRSLTEVFG